LNSPLISKPGYCTDPDLGTGGWRCECNGVNIYPYDPLFHRIDLGDSAFTHSAFTFDLAGCEGKPGNFVYSLTCYTDDTYTTVQECPGKGTYLTYTSSTKTIDVTADNIS